MIIIKNLKGQEEFSVLSLEDEETIKLICHRLEELHIREIN